MCAFNFKHTLCLSWLWGAQEGYCTTLEKLVQYVCTPEQTTRLHSLRDKLKFQKKLPTSKGRRDELTRVVRELMTAILQVAVGDNEDDQVALFKLLLSSRWGESVAPSKSWSSTIFEHPAMQQIKTSYMVS